MLVLPRKFSGLYEQGIKLMGCRDARELVAELEFVWDQIKNNSESSSGSSPGRGVASYTTQTRQFQHPQSGTEGPMRVLSPMSQNDEEERDSAQRLGYDDEEDEYGEAENNDKKTKRWRRSVEQALVKMTAEVAALREQISTGREWQGKKSRSPGRWITWFLWLAIRHALLDTLVLGILLLWLRKRKDRRSEDLVRQGLKIAREYVRMVLPSR